MDYLAIPRPTIDWLLLHVENLRLVLEKIPELCLETALTKGVLAVGALRVAATEKHPKLLAIWNIDYLHGSGSEEWGIIRLSGDFGVLNGIIPATTSLDRAFRVMSLRLQNLLLPEPFIHRIYGGRYHTCVAGGNSQARQASIAFIEDKVDIESLRRSLVIVVGPWAGQKGNPEADTEQLREFLKTEEAKEVSLVSAADAILLKAIQRPSVESNTFRDLRDRFAPKSTDRTDDSLPSIPKLGQLDSTIAVDTISYVAWVANESPLTTEQRNILFNDPLDQHPVRIIGPAGSGKSLLMQLMACRVLVRAQKLNRPCQVLYLVHNNAMIETTIAKFSALGMDSFIYEKSDQNLSIQTLFGLCNEFLKPETVPVIDRDAYETKCFQRLVAQDAMATVLRANPPSSDSHPIFSQVVNNPDLLDAFANLLPIEIGVAIKGHGLGDDRARYVQSETPLSRLHGILTQADRSLVFDVFEIYHREIFENGGLLDSDDLALTLLNRLRTPLWKLKRIKNGYDYVFVDETQLFNENERRLIPLLTKREAGSLSIALAIDAAQDLSGRASSGLALLGIHSISDSQLQTVYRSTRSILALAFHLIQRTRDLFDQVNFPDFTTTAVSVVGDDHPKAAIPILRTGGQLGRIGPYVIKQVERLRKSNIRQIAIVVHAEYHYDSIYKALYESKYPFLEMTKRGEHYDKVKPLIVLTRPNLVGGQEFDAVLAVGIERGSVPPRMQGNEAFAVALEQQALRELYLSFTRARYQLVVQVSRCRGGVHCESIVPGSCSFWQW